ncbi:MAG: shikimate dehydrogenase [Bacteroidota bacterium]
MSLYGLVGRTLQHSFSKQYFSEKFEKENRKGHIYELFELKDISEIDALREKSSLKGFNVTIPYKEEIFPYLKFVEENAQRIGAVNVVKIVGGQFYGYNTDFFGFKESLKNWSIGQLDDQSALVLGTGGASKAVVAGLNSLGISNYLVSRAKSGDIMGYEDLTREIMEKNKLIVNTTPLGMSPNLESRPELPYEFITAEHWMYDLVYNPEETLFLQLGKQKGARTKNGLEMLFLQAEKSWEIWQNQNNDS